MHITYTKHGGASAKWMNKKINNNSASNDGDEKIHTTNQNQLWSTSKENAQLKFAIAAVVVAVVVVGCFLCMCRAKLGSLFRSHNRSARLVLLSSPFFFSSHTFQPMCVWRVCFVVVTFFLSLFTICHTHTQNLSFSLSQFHSRERHTLIDQPTERTNNREKKLVFSAHFIRLLSSLLLQSFCSGFFFHHHSDKRQKIECPNCMSNDRISGSCSSNSSQKRLRRVQYTTSNNKRSFHLVREKTQSQWNSYSAWCVHSPDIFGSPLDSAQNNKTTNKSLCAMENTQLKCVLWHCTKGELYAAQTHANTHTHRPKSWWWW